jgi:N utilization substance protein B
MLYQWEVGGADPDDVMRTYWVAHGPEPPLAPRAREFAEHLVRGTVGDLAAIDPLLSGAAAHWRLDRMALVDRLILRLAVFELLHEPETPPVVVINEAIELARTFSGDESVGFINGVLDGVRKALAAGAAQGS